MTHYIPGPSDSLISSLRGSKGKVFTDNGGQRKIGHPRSVKDATFGRSKSFIFIALSLGPFGTRRWNWEAKMAHCLHLALSSAARFLGKR